MQQELRNLEAKTHCFRDLAPKVKGEGLAWVSPESLNHITQLVAFGKHVKGDDEKTIMYELDLHWGSGLLCPTVRRLVARLLLLCRQVNEGENMGELQLYIERHVSSLVYLTSSFGRELLDLLAKRVKSDLKHRQIG